MTIDDKLTDILINVGETRGAVGQLTEDVKFLKTSLEDKVIKMDCTGRHRMLEESLARSIDTLKEEIRRRAPTHQTNRMLTDQWIKEHEDARVEKRKKSVLFWVSMVGSLLALLGTMATGIYKMFDYMQQINVAIVSQRQEISKEIKNALPDNQEMYPKKPPSYQSK